MGIMWVLIAASVLMALPRAFGVGYTAYFALWYAVFYACAPLAGWSAWLALPRSVGVWRVIVGVAVFLAPVIPIIIVSWFDDNFLWALAWTLLVFWLPQVVCVAGVQFFVFRKPARIR